MRFPDSFPRITETSPDRLPTQIERKLREVHRVGNANESRVIGVSLPDIGPASENDLGKIVRVPGGVNGTGDEVYIAVENPPGTYKWARIYPADVDIGGANPAEGIHFGALSSNQTLGQNDTVVWDETIEEGGFWSHSAGIFTCLRACRYQADAVLTVDNVDERAAWMWVHSVDGEGGGLGSSSKISEDAGSPLAYGFHTAQVGETIHLRTKRDDKDFRARSGVTGISTPARASWCRIYSIEIPEDPGAVS